MREKKAEVASSGSYSPQTNSRTNPETKAKPAKHSHLVIVDDGNVARYTDKQGVVKDESVFDPSRYRSILSSWASIGVSFSKDGIVISTQRVWLNKVIKSKLMLGQNLKKELLSFMASRDAYVNGSMTNPELFFAPGGFDMVDPVSGVMQSVSLLVVE